MPKKIRVYELARELGVENQVVLELAEELKVGVKSHSSSIDEPSADRIRRLAKSKGIEPAPVVEEPKPEKPVSAEPPTAPAAKPVAPEVARPAHRVVRSTGGIPAPTPHPPAPGQVAPAVSRPPAVAEPVAPAAAAPP
ncbi:MAG: translation initiation factor IF-2, partial [Actinobacteria bacterium]|nr:translation initiation factor IF-2 [Actinomycetota bacterium]